MGDQIDITKLLRILLDSHIELSLVMFKPDLCNWILVKFEGTSLNFSMGFSIISKISINIHKYGYNII